MAVNRLAMCALVTGAATVVLCHASDEQLDASRGFYHPERAAQPNTVLGELDGEPITMATYLRYLAARDGQRALRELAFDLALERACRERNLASSAPVLARTLATSRLADSGRIGGDGEPALRLQFLNEALRQQRIDALVRADRVATDGELQALFERRYGPGGVKLRARHVLVAFAATQRRLAAGGGESDAHTVRTAAQARAQELRERLGADGPTFTELLAQSDDRATRSALADSEQTSRAGFLTRADLQRLGVTVQNVLAALDPGGISAPVLSDRGFHLLELLERTTTQLEDVAPALRKELLAGSATEAEIRALRAVLLAKYPWQSK
jgi:hypothetical protein